MTFEPLQINKVGVVDGGHNQVIAPPLCHVGIVEHKKTMAEQLELAVRSRGEEFEFDR